MNAIQLKKLIKDLDLRNSFNKWVYDTYGVNDESFKVGDLELKYVTSYRSDEGDHDSQYFVFSVGGDLFEVPGYYSSWDGADYDTMDFYSVKAVEVKKIEYHKI